MPGKRQRTSEDGIDADEVLLPRKQQRLNDDPLSRRNPNDRLSSISDELTVRILSFLPISTLLDVGLVSRHFHRLACDSQLWRALYYSRFVLPRALRIPGFRDGSKRQGSRLHYSARRAVWADGGQGRRGGLVDMRNGNEQQTSVDWKRQYKLRHNWARGKATVEELDVGGLAAPKKTLVKVVEGIAVTADTASGLRAWDLKTKALLAQAALQDDNGQKSAPTCVGVDEQSLDNKHLDICLGFTDGSFGIWRLDLHSNLISLRQRHAKSSNGALIGIAYRHPYLLTATESVLVSLYDFEQPGDRSRTKRQQDSASSKSKLDLGYESDETEQGTTIKEPEKLPAPILVTSLKSHTSRAPLALSIRSMAGSAVASIAYSFGTLEGWSIGIQDLHIGLSSKGESEITSTRLAYTIPITSAPTRPPSPVTPTRQPSIAASSPRQPSTPSPSSLASDGPTTLRYTHPYLLATLPDNTLVLHVCTSSANALSVSPGIRLWGHTSGISDAEITARGKAVSVSCRGEEIRVWELEGRAGGKSIEVRPKTSQDDEGSLLLGSDKAAKDEWDDRRNWVGFDDEMVIVLKESRDGRESLVVYDFT